MILTLPQIIVIAGLAAVLLELFIGIQTGFDLVLIGSILIISGFTDMVFSDSLVITLGLASLLSFFYIAYGRNRIRQKISMFSHKTNVDKLIGSTGTVVRSITPDTAGLIRINDEDWRALSDEVVYEKDRVKITAIEGVSLRVTKLAKGS